MDFARKQLEKYGWSEGKGLGKAEDGIQKAIKPKPKHGQGGVGHDIADEFTNHWWQKVYNNAADNIEVNKNQKGEIENFSTKKGESINITTKTWVKPKRSKNKKLSTTSNATNDYLDKFINRATLTNGITLVENTKSDNDNDSSDSENGGGVIALPSIQKLTDEELFSACGGRTAHKGARHGIKSNGKLSRINDHEDGFLEKMKAIYNSTEKKSTKKNIGIKSVKTDEEHNSEQSSDIIENDNRLDGIKSNKRKRKRDVIDGDTKVTLCNPSESVENQKEFRKKKKKKKNRNKKQ